MMLGKRQLRARSQRFGVFVPLILQTEQWRHISHGLRNLYPRTSNAQA